jgi:Flp pilus assembly pilin Flp
MDPQRLEKVVKTIEYAVMLVLIAFAVLTLGAAFSESVTGVFSSLVSGL